MFDKLNRPRPLVFGFAGTQLTSSERSLFKHADPFGFILFKRNCADPNQVRWLIKELKQAVGREDVAILIDQEGGRVSRLQPPHWPQHPPARAFGEMYEKDPEWGTEAMQLYARIVGNELGKLGFTINCAPVVDLYIEGATTAIGDRAISRKPAVVAALARTWAEGLLANGILPVIKHFPGHGRLKVDPHTTLPTIDASRAELEAEDFMPFELLKDLPLGMNSHGVFRVLDSEKPASLSSIVTQEYIRGVLGFDGLLLSDDITMKALSGMSGDIARKALGAGTDIVLHCSGDVHEMEAISAVVDPINDESWARWKHAKTMVNAPDPAYNPASDSARLDVLLGGLAYDEKTVA